MFRDLEFTLDAADSWLDLGRDVVIRGDDGSGRSTVLRSLAERLTARGGRAMLLRASGSRDYATLFAHPSLPADLVCGSGPDLVRWLAGELSGEHTTLLIDDPHHLDQGSADAIQQAVDRTGVSVVLTSGEQRAGAGAPRFLTTLLTERAPADVQIRPLGLGSLAELVVQALGGPGDLPLLASAAAQSAGNPLVALAVVDAARYVGAVERRDGRWHITTSLDRVPGGAVVNAYAPRLSAAELNALETVSWTGPVPREDAERMLDRHVLDDLTERGRLVESLSARGVRSLTVSPPALATALRTELSQARRTVIAERAGAIDPRFQQTELNPDCTSDVLLSPPTDQVDVGARWVTGLAARIQEYDRAREAERRRCWSAAPSVRTARPYLALLGRRAAHQELAEVHQQTPLSDQDDPVDRAVFWLQHRAWRRWCGEPSPATAQETMDLAPLAEPHRVHDQLLAAAQSGAPLEPVLDEMLPLGDDLLSALIAVAASGALLQAGRPDLALPLAEGGDLAGHPGLLGHVLAGLGSCSLLMLGEHQQAEQQSRALLETACADLDAGGIRVHGCVLAEVLWRTGHTEQAWGAVNMALRFAISGPAEDPFFRRALALAAVIRARLGDLGSAQGLLADLRSMPAASFPLIDSLLSVAEAEVNTLSRDGEHSDGMPRD